MTSPQPTNDSPQPTTKVCSACGASFGCGAALEHCWCVDLPPLASSQIDTQTDCLCPDCLGRRVAGETPA